MLREAVARLPPRCQEMIRLLFYQQPPMSYRDLAARLGLATGSIGFIRGRCLKRLQRTLEEVGLLGWRPIERATSRSRTTLIDQLAERQHRRARARAFCAGTSSSGTPPSSNGCTPASCGWRGPTCSARTAWRRRRNGSPRSSTTTAAGRRACEPSVTSGSSRGKYSEALEHYDAAVKLFRRAGTGSGRGAHAERRASEPHLPRPVRRGARVGRGRRERSSSGTAISLGLARLDSNVGQHPVSPGPVRRSAGAVRARLRAARRRTANRRTWRPC